MYYISPQDPQERHSSKLPAHSCAPRGGRLGPGPRYSVTYPRGGHCDLALRLVSTVHGRLAILPSRAPQFPAPERLGRLLHLGGGSDLLGFLQPNLVVGGRPAVVSSQYWASTHWWLVSQFLLLMTSAGFLSSILCARVLVSL